MSLPVLHVLGCGRSARVLARWLLEHKQVRIGQICNQSLDSARSAVEFIGAGEAVDQLGADINGGWLLLGLPDGALGNAALGLACRMPGQPELVFHLSGSMPGAILAPLGVPAAAVHPARAFADGERALAAMPGTWLVAEGDRYALDRLKPALSQAGGQWIEIDARGKALYHAATVAASNYIVTLTDLARVLAVQAGLEPAQAGGLLGSLQQGTLDNLRDQSAESALTGPIERSDPAAVARLVEAVEQADPGHARLFRDLVRSTLALAEQKRGPKPGDKEIEALTSRSG